MTDGCQIKCVDPEDQMSVDSYFFASFQDNDHAYAAIQQRLDERPSSDLPQVTSNLSMETIPTPTTVAGPNSPRKDTSSSSAVARQLRNATV